MTRTFSIGEAKTNLSKLVALAGRIRLADDFDSLPDDVARALGDED